MFNIKSIITSIGAIVALVIAAFFGGRMRGKEAAEASADKQRTKDDAAGVKAAAERRVTATKEANDVQQEVNHLPASDIDRELLNTWARKDSGS